MAALLNTAVLALAATAFGQPSPAAHPGMPPPADQPVERTDHNSQLAHEQLVTKVHQGRIDIYFEGDSITRRWDGTDYPQFVANWNQNFHGWNAADFGWGGDTTQNILWRLNHGEFDGAMPKVIVLLAGTNNVGRNPAPALAEDVPNGIKAILDFFRTKAPRATIVLMAIFPRNDSPASNPVIDRINARIATFADGKTVRFVNINDRLADKDGHLYPGMTMDELHPTLKGYQIWADALRPIFTELLGPPAATDQAPPPTGDPSAAQNGQPAVAGASGTRSDKVERDVPALPSSDSQSSAVGTPRSTRESPEAQSRVSGTPAPTRSAADYIPIIREHIYRDYQGMFREQGGAFRYPFITPGSAQYADILWDWDSWLSDIALRQILLEQATADERAKALRYEQGCVLNYLNYGGMDGWIPIIIRRNSGSRKEMMSAEDTYATNMHKPCLAQHAAFLTQLNGGDAEWLREKFQVLQAFVSRYTNHQRNKATGLYFWNDDAAIGVDNDPCTFMRPPKSSGSIYLNCLMYRELLALVYLCDRLDLGEIGREYQRDADALKAAIQEHCWDERDGFFYSVDLNLLPYEPRPFGGDPKFKLHAGNPRNYDCLIQRIDVWSGFLAMWAGVATPEQAKRMVAEHFHNDRTFNAAYGIRTLSKLEKMYNVRASANPSLWTGPIWGVSNYLVFSGLVRYGFNAEARELAEKTITLFGRDFERSGALHEYYLPDNGEPVLNKGFQNWNYLVLNMAAWYEGKPRAAEF